MSKTILIWIISATLLSVSALSWFSFFKGQKEVYQQGYNQAITDVNAEITARNAAAKKTE